MISRGIAFVYRRIIRAIGYALLGPHEIGKTTRAVAREIETAVLRSALKRCGAGVALQCPVFIASPESVEIGSDTSIAAFVHIWGAGGVVLGERVMIGTHTSISSVTHDYGVPDMWRTVLTRPVRIDDDVWIASNVVILPGVRIGRGAVVGAGAVVTDDVGPGEIVMGVPARLYKTRSVT